MKKILILLSISITFVSCAHDGIVGDGLITKKVVGKDYCSCKVEYECSTESTDINNMNEEYRFLWIPCSDTNKIGEIVRIIITKQ